jgi:hypothetical protein
LPELWPDKNEGYLFRAVESTEGLRKVQEALKRIFPNSRGLEIALLRGFKRARYAQCWSKCPENDALWKGYELRIEADRSDVSKLEGVDAHDVRYVDSVNLEEELRSLFTHHEDGKVSWKSEEVLLIKRAQFSHEQEVRLLTKHVVDNVVSRPPAWVKSALIQVFRSEHQAGQRSKEDFERAVDELEKRQDMLPIPSIKKVSIADVPGFIRSVLLHPLAPAQVDGQVSSFCAQHSLNYLGKSRIYDFEI